MKKKTIIFVALIIGLVESLFSQELTDELIQKSIKFSNMQNRIESLVEDITSIENTYLNGVDKSVKQKIISYIKESIQISKLQKYIEREIQRNCTFEIINDYLNFHATDFYKKVDAIESRSINQDEYKKFIFRNDTPKRNELILTLENIYNLRQQNYIYNKNMYVLVALVTNYFLGDSIDYGVSTLIEDLDNYYNSDAEKVRILDMFTTIYRQLNDEDLTKYVDYFVSKNVTIFYRCLYDGYQKYFFDLFQEINLTNASS